MEEDRFTADDVETDDIEEVAPQSSFATAAHKHVMTEQELRAAIENREFVVHYQPRIDLKSTPGGIITGAEALVRWQQPGKKIVYPDDFIPLAERSGHIGALTDQVLSQEVGQIRAWEDKGISLNVSVNLSRQSLGDFSLPNRIGSLLAEKGLPAARLILEITESGAMQDAVRTMEILTRFRLKGFGLSLDDFGTGYSSLIQLHRMPFNEMKIDKSFTIEMAHDDEARKIVISIAELARSLGINLCAEGVETQTALDYLRSINCDAAQGFFFSKAVPADQFVKLLNR